MAMEISIHALHEESDQTMRKAGADMDELFQSTLSMRRATNAVAGGNADSFNFNPRSP